MKKALVLALTAVSVGATLAAVAVARSKESEDGTVLELTSKDGRYSLTALLTRRKDGDGAGLTYDEDEGRRRVIARARRVSVDPEELAEVL